MVAPGRGATAARDPARPVVRVEHGAPTSSEGQAAGRDAGLQAEDLSAARG